MHRSVFLLPCFLLACSGPAADKAIVDVDALSAVSLRATGDIALPEPMKAAAFVPNHVAAWAGHILLLSETGDIWRTTSEGDVPVLVAKGPYKDMYGLSRPQKAGVFLALPEQSGSEQGGPEKGSDVTAFIESDDQGNYKPLAVSQSGSPISHFCTGSSEGVHWVIGEDGALHLMTAAVEDDMIAEITYGETYTPKSPPTDCHVADAGTLLIKTENGQWFSYGASGEEAPASLWNGGVDVTSAGSAGQLGMDAKSGAPLFAADGTLSKLIIEDGLSIKGAGNVRFMASSGYNMGSVFDEGIIIAGDAGADRLVLISTGYVQRALSPEN